MMIDKTDFERMQKEFKKLDEEREKIIVASRDIIKLSKQTIYSVHRNEIKEAEKTAKEMKESVAKLKKMASIKIYEQHQKIAEQEYVEAIAFLTLVKNKKLPTSTELNVEAEHYLLGLTDLGGELVRKAVNEAIKGNYAEAIWIKEVFTEIYGQFLNFDFRNGELRKKFDGMKYDLKKLEDLALQIKMKNG